MILRSAHKSITVLGSLSWASGFALKRSRGHKAIAIINEVLTPTEEEVAKARQVLVVNRQGVGSVDGKMVDEAIARKARLILERAGIAAEG